MKPTLLMAAVVASSVWTRDISIAYIGIPANLLVPSVLGTIAAFGVDEKPIRPRSRMWMFAFACVFMGGSFTAITTWAIAHFMQVEVPPGLAAGVCAAVSFCTKFALPWLADVVRKGKWLSWVPFINRKDE